MKHLIVIRSIIFGFVALIFTSTLMAQDCTIEVTVGDNLNFIPAEMSISKSECTNLTISLSHNGSLPRNGMGHNWALAGLSLIHI